MKKVLLFSTVFCALFSVSALQSAGHNLKGLQQNFGLNFENVGHDIKKIIDDKVKAHISGLRKGLREVARDRRKIKQIRAKIHQNTVNIFGRDPFVDFDNKFDYSDSDNNSDSDSDSDDNDKILTGNHKISNQYITWKILEKIAKTQGFNIPTIKEIFSTKLGYDEGTIKKITDLDQESFVTTALDQIRTNVTIDDIAKLINSSKNSGICKWRKDVCDKNLSEENLGFIINHNIQKFFQFYNTGNKTKKDFIAISMDVFYSALLFMKKNSQSVKLLDIFNIATYIQHKMTQFDCETSLSLEKEKDIKDMFSQQFAIYRRSSHTIGEKKALQQINDQTLLLSYNFSKKVKQYGESEEAQYIAYKMLEINKIRIPHEVAKNSLGEAFITKFSKNINNDYMIYDSLKDLYKECDDQYKRQDSWKIDGLKYAFYQHSCSRLDNNKYIAQSIKEISKNILFQYIVSDDKNLSVKDIVEYINFIEQQGERITDEYGTACHEAAHAFIAKKYNCSISMAAVINNRRDADGYVSTGSDDPWEDMSIDVAGVLGDFFVLPNKLNSSGASSDFESAIENAKKILANKQKFKKIIKKYEKDGEKLLKNCKQLQDRGNNKLDKFLTKEIKESLDTEGDKEVIRNLIAGCIVEVLEKLTEKDNNKSYVALAEKFYQKGALNKEQIKQYCEKKYAEEDKMFILSVLPQEVLDINKKKHRKQKELLMLENRGVAPLGAFVDEDIKRNDELIQEKIEKINKWDAFLAKLNAHSEESESDNDDESNEIGKLTREEFRKYFERCMGEDKDKKIRGLKKIGRFFGLEIPRHFKKNVQAQEQLLENILFHIDCIRTICSHNDEDFLPKGLIKDSEKVIKELQNIYEIIK